MSNWAVFPCNKSKCGSILWYNDFLVSWKSCTQYLVALSTTKAEMITPVKVYKERNGVHKLFEQSKFFRKIWKTSCYNRRCINISNETDYSGREDPIDRRYLAIHDVGQRQEIIFLYRPATENRADILTKALSTQEHNRETIALSVEALQWAGELLYIPYRIIVVLDGNIHFTWCW